MTYQPLSREEIEVIMQVGFYGQQITVESFHRLLATIEADRKRIEQLETTNREWLKENGPGGWIDNLRKALKAKEKRIAELEEERVNAIPESEWREQEIKMANRIAELETIVAGLVRRIELNPQHMPDHACAECVPHSDMLKGGFRCAYHAAKAIALAKQGE